VDGVTGTRRRELADALSQIVQSAPPLEQRSGRARLDQDVTAWSAEVPTPADVLRLVSEVRQRTLDDFSLHHEEVLARAGLVAVAAVSKRHVHQALTDALTGLATRARLDEEIQHLVAVSSRLRTPLTAVMLDVDGLKQINDEQGHAAGDVALADVGLAIRTHLRQADRAFRWGGDEFVLFLPDTTAEGARVLVDRIVTACSTPVSAGIATHSGDAADLDVAAWLTHADVALYGGRRARRAGTMRQRRYGPATMALTSVAAAALGWLVLPAAAHSLATFGSPDSVAHQSAAARPTSPRGITRRQPTPTRSLPAQVAKPASVRPAIPALTPVSLPVPVTTPRVPVVPVSVPSLPTGGVPTAPVPTAPIPTPLTPAPAPSPSGLVTGILRTVGKVVSALL
jgi:diguanylate cyclase (GGDEF)-like protein